VLITATEFKKNVGHYLDLSSVEDILISRKGKIIAKVSNPVKDKVGLLDGLVGIAEAVQLSDEEARAERLAAK